MEVSSSSGLRGGKFWNVQYTIWMQLMDEGPQEADKARPTSAAWLQSGTFLLFYVEDDFRTLRNRRSSFLNIWQNDSIEIIYKPGKFVEYLDYLGKM